jgi:hypothetical protein
VTSGQTIEVTNVPISGGHHLGMTVTTGGSQSVTLTLTGDTPAGPILFQLPAFVNNIASSSAGTINRATGTVTLSTSTRTVTVTMRHGV